jgi:hypothetical protein
MIIGDRLYSIQTENIEIWLLTEAVSGNAVVRVEVGCRIAAHRIHLDGELIIVRIVSSKDVVFRMVVRRMDRRNPPVSKENTSRKLTACGRPIRNKRIVVHTIAIDIGSRILSGCIPPPFHANPIISVAYKDIPAKDIIRGCRLNALGTLRVKSVPFNDIELVDQIPTAIATKHSRPKSSPCRDIKDS